MSIYKRTLAGLACATAAFLAINTASAGNIYLTGHDVLLHSGQNGYDNVILDYLRAGSEPAANYNIGLVRGFDGSVGTVGTNTLEGFGTITTRDLTSFADSASFSAFLSTVDVLVIPSHTSCGGCDLSSADADILESFASGIAAFFNAGGDIYANSGATDTTFYNFLPASAVASGTSISGSTGFTATAAGTAIGITSDMINGFPTHNRFFDFAPVFTTFETRDTEVISIGLRGGTIGGGGIIITSVPEPSILSLLAISLLGLGIIRRRKEV